MPKHQQFEGYRAGDITYCVDPGTAAFFPVRVTQIGCGFATVESLRAEASAAVCSEFDADASNRRFVRPALPAASRFGGGDERPVNTERASGQELRLLPSHYGTLTGRQIWERHRENPEDWPLPTGVVYERWFQGG